MDNGTTNPGSAPLMQSPAANVQQMLGNSVPNGSSLSSWPHPDPPATNKDWHAEVTIDLRHRLVGRIVKAIFPSPNPADFHDQRIKELIQYARKVEKDMFENADDREEYYHLIAEKIYRIQKELAEKKQKRLAAAVGPSVVPNPASQPTLPDPVSAAHQVLQDSTANNTTPDLPIEPSAAKSWHADVTVDLRNRLVDKLVKAVFPSSNPAAIHDQRMKDLIQHCRKKENDFFEAADSREEYYHLTAEKIYRMQKELAEKKQKRLADAVGSVELTRGPDGKFGIVHRGALVVEARKGTSAEAKGITRGHEIISINEVRVETFTHFEIEKMLGCAIGNVKLTIRYSPELLKDLGNN